MVTLVILCGGSTCNVALPVKMLSFRVTTVTGTHRNELRAKSFSGRQNQNPRGAQQSLIWGGGGGAPTRGATSYPFIYHFWLKRYPFRSPSINKWHPFHIPSLELCIPFKWCNCSLQNINKSVRFLDFFTAMKSVCSLFWAFLTTEMTDFSTLSYT